MRNRNANGKSNGNDRVSATGPSGGEAAVRLDTACAWLGGTLLVTDNRGECGTEQLSGFYVRETRHLSKLRLEVDGKEPWMCEWSRPRPDRLAFVFVFPELTEFGGGGSGVSTDEETTDERGVPHRSLDLRLLYVVELDRLRATQRVTNRARREVVCEIGLAFAADYADLLEANDGKRQQEAPIAASVENGAAR